MQKIQGKGDLDYPSNGVSRNDRRENKHGLDAAQTESQAGKRLPKDYAVTLCLCGQE